MSNRLTKLAASLTGMSLGQKKGISRMRFPQQLSNTWNWLPRTERNYEAEVGDGLGNSIVVAAVSWISRNFPEAPLSMVTKLADGTREPIARHRMLDLIEQPNPYYSGILMWMGTLVDYTTTGNAYWLKVKSRNEDTAQLWYVPASTMEPRGDNANYITHYEYSPNPGDESKQIIKPENVVHFRNGLDPKNVRKGLSPLASLYREIFTDDEAANFSASLLANMGVPGVVISPAKGTDWEDVFDQEVDVSSIKNVFKQLFGGDRRGEPMIMEGPTDIKVISWNPEQMNLKDLRRLPEERVTAVIGLSAMVLGLGAGLDRSTFCLPAESRIWTPRGPVSIVDVQEGEEVWSFEDGEVVRGTVTASRYNGDVPIYEVRTKNRVLRASGNHPVLVRVPGNLIGANKDRSATYVWRCVDELTIDDYVVQVQSLPDVGAMRASDGTIVSPEFMQFLGAVIGDGTVSTTGVRISMPPGGDITPRDRTVAFYMKLVGQLPFTKRDGDPVFLQERERDFGFSSVSVARRLTSLGFGGRAKTKRVPSWVFELSRPLRLAFLAGVVDSDGSINKLGCMRLVLANEELVHDIKMLLVSCGIQCSNVAKIIIPESALPNPGLYETYTAWGFTVSSAVSVAEIPFVDPLYRERVNANQHRHRPGGFDAQSAGLSADLGFYKVRSVEIVGEGAVYDLTVEGVHSFVAEGMVVHNSNYSESLEAAYENNLIPTQRLLSAELKLQLLPDFESNPLDFDIFFDTSNVRALSEDVNEETTRLVAQLTSGGITVAEFRTELGLPVDDTHEYYLRGTKTEEVPADTGFREAPTVDPSVDQANENEEDNEEDGEKGIVSKALFSAAQKKRDLLFIEQQDAALEPIIEAFERDLGKTFRKSGAIAADEYLRALGQKATEENEDKLIARIMAAADLAALQARELGDAYISYYTLTGEVTFEGISSFLEIELGFNINDPLAQKIVETGGKRVGLVDMSAQAKDSLFRALAEGRANNFGPDKIARLIRQYVPEGRFTNAGAGYRANLIARTEIKYAQNISSIAAYRTSEAVTSLRAYDAQAGATDEECESRDLGIFSLDEAASETDEEHPNGTLSWAPITGSR